LLKIYICSQIYKQSMGLSIVKPQRLELFLNITKFLPILLFMNVNKIIIYKENKHNWDTTLHLEVNGEGNYIITIIKVNIFTVKLNYNSQLKCIKWFLILLYDNKSLFCEYILGWNIDERIIEEDE